MGLQKYVDAQTYNVDIMVNDSNVKFTFQLLLVVVVVIVLYKS